MKGFILAAGYGERLRPLTDTTPKPLIRIAGIPAILYGVALLKEAGVNEVICNLHYLPEKIRDFFSIHNNFGLNIRFSHEEEILGTGGAVKKCQEPLGHEPFLLINSDVITDMDLNSLVDTGAPAAALSDYGSGRTVSVAHGRICDFKGVLESQIPPLYDYTGIAYLDSAIFRYLNPEHSSIVYTGYTGLAAEKKLKYYHHDGFWGDIGTLENIKSVSEYLLKDQRLIQRVIKSTGYQPVT